MLKEAVLETFAHRKTTFEDIIAFDDEFTKDTVRQNRGKAFVKKKKAVEEVNFEDAIELVRTLLNPVVEAIKSERNYDKEWLCDKEQWQ